MVAQEKWVSDKGDVYYFGLYAKKEDKFSV